jgi:uncharacterized protein YukE
MVRYTAELTTIRTIVEELQARVLGLAKGCEGASREDMARPLFEAERALRTAGKQVARAEKMLG